MMKTAIASTLLCVSLCSCLSISVSFTENPVRSPIGSSVSILSCDPEQPLSTKIVAGNTLDLTSPRQGPRSPGKLYYLVIPLYPEPGTAGEPGQVFRLADGQPFTGPSGKPWRSIRLNLEENP